jgi:hypothetical protein
MKYLKHILESFNPDESNPDDYYSEIPESEFVQALTENGYMGTLRKSSYIPLSDFKQLMTVFKESGVEFQYHTSTKLSNIPTTKLNNNIKVNQISDIRSGLDSTKWSIFVGKDEWFYCYCCEGRNGKLSRSGIRVKYKYYKCDQFDGLIQFLKDKGILCDK